MADGLRYKDKVTIITGGSSGIGEGCVLVFVRNGSKVVFCSNVDSEGKEVEKKMNQIGPGEATFIFTDLTKEEDVKNLIDKTVEKYGRIDCVINNAGRHPSYSSIDGYSVEDFRYIIDLNVIGYFMVSKYAIPHLRKTEGNIINNCSMVANTGNGYASIYVASKGACSAMTKALAIDEAKYNVRVNSISPGSIDTPMADVFINSTTNPEHTRQLYRNLSVLGRRGTPEECGMTCLYLASDATFCTGIDIQLTGGSGLGYGLKNMRLPESWPACILNQKE